MAGSGGLDTTFLNNVTRAKFLPAVKNVLYNQSPFFQRLFVKGRIQRWTGTSLLWDVPVLKHAAVGRFTGYDVFANQPINPLVQATLSEGSYYAALAISGTEKRKNTGTQGAERLLDALKVQHDNAIATLKDSMYTDAFGDGSLVGNRQGLIGLSAAVSATNTYANILRTTYSAWQANVNSTALTIANLKDPTSTSYMPSVMRTLYTNSTHDHSPDLLIFNETQYNLYQDIAGINNLRFDNEIADLGFGGVKFQNATMVFDKFCPSAKAYFLATQDWSVFVLDGANFDMPEEGWMRPPTQDAFITQIIWSGQMRLDSPWHQGAFTNIGAS